MEWICLPLISFTAMFNQKEFRIELETFNINSILCTSDYINKISGRALGKKNPRKLLIQTGSGQDMGVLK